MRNYVIFCANLQLINNLIQICRYFRAALTHLHVFKNCVLIYHVNILFSCIIYRMSGKVPFELFRCLPWQQQAGITYASAYRWAEGLRLTQSVPNKHSGNIGLWKRTATSCKVAASPRATRNTQPLAIIHGLRTFSAVIQAASTSVVTIYCQVSCRLYHHLYQAGHHQALTKAPQKNKHPP